MAFVGTKKLSGVQYEVHANQSGYFQITSGERVLGAGETLDKAVQAARSTLHRQKVRVSVPFIQIMGLRRGTATGIHERSGEILVRWEDGNGAKKGAETIRSYSPVLKADVPEDTLNLMAGLQSEIDQATKRLRELESEWKITNLQSEVSKAVEAASGK